MLSMQNKGGGNIIPSLTGLRQIAAFFVVLHHLLPKTSSGYFNSVIKELNVGVSIFFVLSGFLIAHRYMHDYRDGFIWTKKYMVKRFARIFPMYFFITSLTYLFKYLVDDKIDQDLLYSYFLNITLVRGFSMNYVYSGIAQGWTLTVEECFYFLAPMLFFVFFKKRLLFFIAPIIIYILGLLFVDLFQMNYNQLFILTIFGRIFEFFFGITGFLMYKSFARKTIHFSLTNFSIFIFLLLLNLQILIATAYSVDYAIQSLLGWFVNSFIIANSIAFLIIGLCTENTFLNRILSSDLLQILGKSSYSLYLIHWGVFSYLIGSFLGCNFFITILCVQILAVIFWFFIEEPANSWVNNFFVKKTN